MNFVRLWLRRLPIDYIIFLLLEMNRILGYKALIITKTKKKRKKIYIKKKMETFQTNGSQRKINVLKISFEILYLFVVIVTQKYHQKSPAIIFFRYLYASVIYSDSLIQSLPFKYSMASK